MNEANTQNLWIFHLGTQERATVPIRIFVIFQQSDREHDQTLNKDTFVRLPVKSAQCVNGTERYPDTGILLNYDDDDYSQGYTQVKEVFTALTHDDMLQPYISQKDFRPSNDGDDVGYKIHAFDIRYQKKFESSQQIRVEFKFSEDIPAGIYAYGLVLTIRLSSISSDGQKVFDLI